MTVYLDTSSLVTLYVDEPGSGAVRTDIARAAVVATSVIAYPEARAAMARRYREGALTRAAFSAAKRSLDADWPKYLAVVVTEGLCREAGRLAERYALRGYDSVHLASYLEVARHAGAVDTRFSSFDVSLNDAAKRAARALARAASRHSKGSSF